MMAPKLPRDYDWTMLIDVLGKTIGAIAEMGTHLSIEHNLNLGQAPEMLQAAHDRLTEIEAEINYDWTANARSVHN